MSVPTEFGLTAVQERRPLLVPRPAGEPRPTIACLQQCQPCRGEADIKIQGGSYVYPLKIVVFHCFYSMSLGFKMGFEIVPSGKRLHNYGKSPFLVGKSTISMAMFNSKLLNYQRVPQIIQEETMT